MTIKAIAVKDGMIDSAVVEAKYFITQPPPEPLPVAALEFRPAAGTFDSTQQVEIICATPGATIYYTLDGSAPTKESMKCVGTITIAASANFKAFAVKDGMKDSAVAEAEYVILIPVATPVFRPVGGSIYTSTQEVEITCATAGAAIYYTLDGSAPTAAGFKYEKPITVSKTTVIKAIAVKDGMRDSGIKEANYPIHLPVSEPVVSVAGGSYDATFEVTIATNTEGAKIYYTIDGTNPTIDTGVLYTSPVSIAKPLTIKAIAVKEEMTDSNVIEAAYVVPTELAATPVITPNGGFFYYQAQVTITCATAGAEIYYTKDGSAPSKLSAKYEAPFIINTIGTAVTVKAIAYKAGMFDSMQAVSNVFTIAVPPPPPQKPATPVIGETTGKDAGKLTLTCSTAGAKMYYTLDGSAPTASSSLYDADAKISIAFNTPGLGGALKAVAIANGLQSDIASIVIAKDNASLNAAIEDSSNASFVVAGGTNYNGSDYTIPKTFIFKETISGVKPNKIVTISARDGMTMGRIDEFDIAFYNANPSAGGAAPKLNTLQRPLYGGGSATGYAISTINITSGDFSSYVNDDEVNNMLNINRPDFTMTGVSASGANKTLFKRRLQIYGQSNITLKNFAIELNNDKNVMDIQSSNSALIEGLNLLNNHNGSSKEISRVYGCSGSSIKNNTIDAFKKSRAAFYFINCITTTFTGNTVKGSIKVEHKYSGVELSSIVSLFSSNTANIFYDPYITVANADNKLVFQIEDSGSFNINGSNFEYGSAQIENLIGTGNTFNDLNQGGAKFDMFAWPAVNYNYGYYYGDTVPERLFIRTGLSKKAGDDGFINVTFAAKGAAPAGAPKVRTRFLESAKPFTDAWTDKPDAAIDNTQALAEITGVEATGEKTYFVRLKSSGDTGSPSYNGYSEIISISVPANSVILAAGSHGTAGDTKVTGLTSGSKYVIKASGGNWLKVLADGTTAASSVPAGTDAGLAKAAVETAALTGTEITGLNNFTTYYVYQVVDNISETAITYTIKNITDNADIDLAGTSSTQSNLSFTITNLLKIASGNSGAAKVSVITCTPMAAPRLAAPALRAPQRSASQQEQLLDLIGNFMIGTGKLIVSDQIKFSAERKLVEVRKNSDTANGTITLGSGNGDAIGDTIDVYGSPTSAGTLTISSTLSGPSDAYYFKLYGGHVTFDNASNARLIYLDNTAAYSGHVTFKSNSGKIQVPASRTGDITLSPTASDSIKGSIELYGGTNVSLTSDMAIQDGKALNVGGITLTIAAGTSLIISATGEANYAMLSLSNNGAIVGADNTAKVNFAQYAKYQQGDTTVRFCDVAADFDITGQITIDVTGDGSGIDDQLRAGEYVWNGSKFVRAETCFAAGTKVLMADGSLKSIENITVGDSVLSYDFTGNHETASSVFKTMNREASGYYRLNGLKVTGEHPFAVGRNQWRKVKEIKTGDELIGRGNNVAVQTKSSVDKKITVYNISVTGTRNYYVFDGSNYYLVHNK